MRQAKEVGPEIVNIAKKIAIREMKGHRNGSYRPSWRHPEDVVELVRKVPGPFNENSRRYLEAVAWLHDVLEDTNVTPEELIAEGIPEHVVEGVIALTKRKGLSTEVYYWILNRRSDLVKIVKCCDRIANLREGKNVFEARRWERYVQETEGFVWPLTFDVGLPWAEWAERELEAAAGVFFKRIYPMR